MKITQLDIEGFRSLKNVSWKPGDLNVIIGPNGSGKSNLLMALELVNAGARRRLPEYVQAAGGLRSLSWDAQFSPIQFKLVTSGDKPAGEPSVTYEAAIQAKMLSPFAVVNEALKQDGQTNELRLERIGNFAELIVSDFHISWDETLLPPDQLAVATMADSLIPRLLTDGRLVQDYTPLWSYRSFLENWSIHQDLNVSRLAPARLPVVLRREPRIAADGHNITNVLHTRYTGDRNFKLSIDSAMRAAFGSDYEELLFSPASDQRLELQVRWKTLDMAQSAVDFSDGTLRFLLLIAILAIPDPPPLIAIDEPETGLHPSMLPIVAEFAVDAGQRTQVIMTTHSERFLDAFGDARPTTTVAKWENGETTLTVLGEDELAYWLKEYSLGKLYRTGELEAMA